MSLVRRSSSRSALLGCEQLEERTVFAGVVGDNAAAVNFVSVNDWGAGFQGEIRIANDETRTFNGWTVEFDLNRQIGDVWNAQLVSHTGNHYVFKNHSWNVGLGVGSQVSFGFIGGAGSAAVATNFTFNGISLNGTTPPPAPPSISIADPSAAETNGSTTVVLQLSLSKAWTSAVQVNWATANGTATGGGSGGSDYATSSGTATFAAGATNATISVVIRGDAVVEPDETFRVILSNPVNATIADGEGLVTILNDDVPPVVIPAVSISDATVVEGNPGQIASSWLHTSGNQIVDEAGNAVRISAVNWFGMETETYAPHGLWTRNWREMMDEMKGAGFNAIRLPFSVEMVATNAMPQGLNYSLNPDLAGLSGLQVMDKIVAYAGTLGMRIILDCHRSAHGNGPNENGLWYTGAFSESAWINAWTTLATRYANNPTVIGADILNEPHAGASWGTGNLATDWRLAAERAGNAILAVNPNWLIVVEGIETGSSGNTWWGGNLSLAGQFPVRLNVAGRLVYSPHDYPASVYPQQWFNDPNYPNNLDEVWDANWGYLFRQNIAPIFLGEFGSKLATESDRLWAQTMVKYLGGDLDLNGSNDLPAGKVGPSWAWWSWNPNSTDTGGILADDWRTILQEKINLLDPIEFDLIPATGASPATRTLTFTVTLSSAPTSAVTVQYSAVGDTATAGADFTAASGTVTFAAGETSKIVSITVLADLLDEANETLRVVLSNAIGMTIADGAGVGTIVDDDDAAPPAPMPSLTVGDVSVVEGNSGTKYAVFTVTLSAASSLPATVNYMTTASTATAGIDYTTSLGTLTFAPGVTSLTVSVPIFGDAVVEPNEAFFLNLSGAANATIARSKATATITNDDVATPTPTAVAFDVSDDWGSGFVAGMTISNGGAAAIAGWTLEFTFDRNITGIWGAEIVSHVGNRYVIRNLSWNSQIAPGGSATFGFQGVTGNVTAGPTELVLNGQSVASGLSSHDLALAGF